MKDVMSTANNVFLRRRAALGRAVAALIGIGLLVPPLACDRSSSPAGAGVTGATTTAAAPRSSEPCPLLADDFEGERLAAFWLAPDYGDGLYVPGAVKTSARFARRGKQSIEVTVREGDIEQAGDAGTRVERADLDSGHFPLMGCEAWYAFSVLVPPEFPVVDTRLVFGTCKQTDVGRPIMAQRYQNGRHTLTVESHGRKKTFPLPPIRPGQWMDVVYHLRYMADDSGIVEVWIDGKQEVAYTGPTAEADHRNAFYHKVGLYRDRMKQPMTIYFDDYRMGPTRESLASRSGGDPDGATR